DDLIIGSGRTGHLTIFRNNGAGGFEPWQEAVGTEARDDQTGIVTAKMKEGTTTLVVGSANYEISSTNSPAATMFSVQGKHVSDIGELAGSIDSTGPLALADLDGSGKLELFVGGRLVAGHYLAPASS